MGWLLACACAALCPQPPSARCHNRQGLVLPRFAGLQSLLPAVLGSARATSPGCWLHSPAAVFSFSGLAKTVLEQMYKTKFFFGL